MTLNDFISLFWDAIEEAFSSFKGRPITSSDKIKLENALNESVGTFIAKYNVPGLKQTMTKEAMNILKKISN